MERVVNYEWLELWVVIPTHPTSLAKRGAVY